MARFKKIPQAKEGKIVYGDGIVDGIVLLAVKEIPFVELCADAPRKQMRSSAIKVKKEKDGIHVDVTVRIHYAQSVSDTAFKIQEAVRHNVEAMTEYHVASVNVTIHGVTFDEKVEEAPVQAPASENVKEG